MKKQRKKTDLKENAGKYILDICKLFFGAVFIGGLLRLELTRVTLILGGFTIAFILCVIGLLLVSKAKEENKDE